MTAPEASDSVTKCMRPGMTGKCVMYGNFFKSFSLIHIMQPPEAGSGESVV